MTLPFNPDSITDPKVPVSPLSIKNQLNWTPRVAAHVEPWFNTASTSHLNIGYTSNDPIVVAEQVTYLLSRGVDFVIFDWYGRDAKFEDSTCVVWKAECEKQGLNFAFCLDHGMLKHMSPGQTPLAYFKAQFQYLLTTYCVSKNYERLANGKFLVIEFGMEANATDMGNALTSFPQFAMLWENSGGFNQVRSAGAFAWIGTSPTNPQSCIENNQTNFLHSAAAHPTMLSMASLCKGFDDHSRKPGTDPTKSCWNYPNAPARITPEKQGQTFLNVIDILNNSTFKPPYLQIVTFNDHEEGSFVEWGIDSQLTITASETAGIASFTLSGNLNTVDHIEVYIDGVLAGSQAPAAVLAVDLTLLTNLSIGNHVVYVVAVGKAFFQNKISATVSALSKVVWS